jgi:3-deoxy-D-manno-octulosonate 8-phosphate phosphatase (KDO 8-P phosphatase)
MELSGEARKRALRVRFLLLDVDGVLTDGRILYLPGHPEDEAKAFNSRDGVGIRLAQRAGIGVGLLTGRRSETVARRARELGLDTVLQGANPKLPVFEEWSRTSGIPATEICYVGDDVVDLPVLQRVLLPATVADAHEEARRAALVVSDRPGGDGAVREITDALLRAQGKWDDALAGFLE